MTNAERFASRLTELRTDKNVSAREMSLQLGFSSAYINMLEAAKCLPSLSSFFDICAFLGVTPMEFFDWDNHSPKDLGETVEYLRSLGPEDLALVRLLVQRLREHNQTEI